MPKPKMMIDKTKPSEPKPKKVDAGTYELESFSNPEIVYTIDAVNGTCTCPFYEKRMLECKHLKLVNRLIEAGAI